MLAVFCGIALPAPIRRASIYVRGQAWEWDDETDSIWSPVSTGNDSYYVSMAMYSESYLVKPNGKGLVTRVRIA